MKHLYLHDTGKTGCGLPSERRSCTVDSAHVTCEKCKLAASAWRREATRALRSAIRAVGGHVAVDENFTTKPSDLIAALLDSMSGARREKTT